MRSQCNAEMGLDMLLLMDTQVVDTFVAKYKAWQIVKDVASMSTLSKIEVPKLTKKNWKDFHSALIETFGKQRGVSSVPLSYVIQANGVNDYKLAYESTEKQLIACLSCLLYPCGTLQRFGDRVYHGSVCQYA